MRLALAEARRARGRTHPNPPVGAVIFRGPRVLGRGRTRPVGGAHAEVVALESAARRHGARSLRGASMAVTLEPCAHTGRTGPCTHRLLEAGVKRVFVGHRDPHPEVSGRGLRALRRAGVEVRVGLLEDRCREEHRGFLSVLERGRPFVQLKLAASLDGRIATSSGESRWITGEAARAAVHRLRARSDAVWVGSGTALADDPTLDARRGDRVIRRPVRVVADTRLRVPASAALLRGEPGSAWLLCARSAPQARRRKLEQAGARLIDVPVKAGRLDLRRGLEELARQGLSELLVEGGGELAASLWRQDLVDELHWFLAPKLIGADGVAALGGLGLRALADARTLGDLRLRRLGADLHLWGPVRRAEARGSQ